LGGSSSVRGDQTIYHTDNLCFDGTDRGAPMAVNGQLWIGATASDRADNGGHVRLGSITSPLGTLQIGYSAPNITLDLSGGSVGVDSVAVQTGTTPVVPTAGGLLTFNGAVVAAGTNPVRTDGTGANTLALEVQTSQALAAADATKIGLSNFSSNEFSVAATGFVTSKSGWILLSTVNTGGATSVSFTSLMSSTYTSYFITGGATNVATDGADLQMQFSIDNGATWLAADYLAGVNTVPYNSTVSTNKNSTTIIPVLSSHSSNGGGNFLLKFSSNTAQRPNVQGTGLYLVSGGTANFAAISGWYNVLGATINAIRFINSSGTNISGVFSLYGLKES